jgi:hypothetical protein
LEAPLPLESATFGRPEVAPAGAPPKSCQRLRDWVPEGLILAGARLRGTARCERFTENAIWKPTCSETRGFPRHRDTTQEPLLGAPAPLPFRSMSVSRHVSVFGPSGRREQWPCITQGCRMSVRAGLVFEALRFVPVRVKIRLRVTRFVSCVSEIGLRVTRVGIRVFHCVCVCVSACHACRVSCMSRVTRVKIVACHACRVPCVSGSVAVRFVSVSGSCVFVVRVCFCAFLIIPLNFTRTSI